MSVQTLQDALSAFDTLFQSGTSDGELLTGVQQIIKQLPVEMIDGATPEVWLAYSGYDAYDNRLNDVARGLSAASNSG